MPFLKGHTHNVGRILSQETKDKISKSLTGHFTSEETKKKISESEKRAGRTISPELRIKLTKAKKGIIFTEKHRRNLSNSLKGRRGAWKGKKFSEEHCRKLSLKKIGISTWNKGKPCTWSKGELNHNWKGGITPLNNQIRHSLEYKEWRTAVFKRDNYMCIIGGELHGNKLQADHIKPFATHPHLRFDINNGRTLCFNCHKKTETWGINYSRYTQL